MISCGDQNNRQTFERASYNHSGLVHWFSIQFPNGTVCVTKYTAAGHVCVALCACVLAYKCERSCVWEGLVVIDVYRIDVCLEYLWEEECVCMCVYFYWVVTTLSGVHGGEGHKGEVWIGDVLTGRTSVFFFSEKRRLSEWDVWTMDCGYSN